MSCSQSKQTHKHVFVSLNVYLYIYMHTHQCCLYKSVLYLQCAYLQVSIYKPMNFSCTLVPGGSRAIGLDAFGHSGTYGVTPKKHTQKLVAIGQTYPELMRPHHWWNMIKSSQVDVFFYPAKLTWAFQKYHSKRYPSFVCNPIYSIYYMYYRCNLLVMGIEVQYRGVLAPICV